jgi:hypothetical protein
MRDIFVVLGEKEAELKKLQTEIETLRAAARLLTDEADRGRKTADGGLAVVGENSKEARVAAGGLKQFP